MTRTVLILAAAGALGACAPVVVEQPAGAAIPDIFAAQPIAAVVIEPAPEPLPVAAPRPTGPVGPLPEAPEGAGEGLPPTGEAACGGVGIEANC